MSVAKRRPNNVSPRQGHELTMSDNSGARGVMYEVMGSHVGARMGDIITSTIPKKDPLSKVKGDVKAC